MSRSTSEAPGVCDVVRSLQWSPVLCGMDGEGHTGVHWTPPALSSSLCRYILSHPVYVVLGIETRASHMLGRSSVN